ncbi:MAG: hypothetical protein QGH33_05905, partial [Pirellulaceae bacterium]|nr:hypothetical protein [Pirellulaceae bacterium]
MTLSLNVADLLARATEGIKEYLHRSLEQDLIDAQQCADAMASTIPNLSAWLADPYIDRISPNTKPGIANAIQAGQWEAVVNAFRRDVGFGTGGIRGMMAFDRQSIVRLKEEGIDAPILKGPNTINNMVLLRVSAGVARFGREKGYRKIVIGYDSRVRGRDFAHAIGELFVAFGFTVLLSDEPCPYPEVTFAIPYSRIRADLGILISASHNDYRYNGYKLSCANGSQFDPTERDEMYNHYISKATFKDIELCPLTEATPDKLLFFGGKEALPDFECRNWRLVDVHGPHRDHIISLLADPQGLAEHLRHHDRPLRIGYCAFHGVGGKAVPRLMAEIGFNQFDPITVDGLNDLDGMFPSFCSDPGREQQPDPGDARAAKIAVDQFQRQYPGRFDDTDILIGTDPDADRCGVVVKVPQDQQHLYEGRDHALLPADDMWALIVWYRLHTQIKNHGIVVDAEKMFVVQSVTTSDSIVRLALKHGLGVVKTWVGFANLAAGTRMIWDKHPLPSLREGRASPQDMLCHPFVWEFEGMDEGKRSFNVAAMEQSNGFSILGGPPPDERSLGRDGHVRDKDGTLAAVLIAEIAAYAKANGTTIFAMIDENIHLDPDIGLFVNHYEPDPLDGEYPGIQGDRKKQKILRRALGMAQWAKAGGLKIGPFDVTDACIYRTGKYDR